MTVVAFNGIVFSSTPVMQGLDLCAKAYLALENRGFKPGSEAEEFSQGRNTMCLAMRADLGITAMPEDLFNSLFATS